MMLKENFGKDVIQSADPQPSGSKDGQHVSSYDRPSNAIRVFTYIGSTVFSM